MEAIDEGCRVDCKCYHSQEKNGTPHTLSVKVKKREDSVSFFDAKCTCKVGLGGHCGHICGLLYQLAEYKIRDVKAIPVDVAKTSLKITFHEPGGPSITGKRIDQVTLKRHIKNPQNPADSNGVRDVQSTLYNAVGGPIPILNKLQEYVEKEYETLPVLSSLTASCNDHDDSMLVMPKFG